MTLFSFKCGSACLTIILFHFDFAAETQRVKAACRLFFTQRSGVARAFLFPDFSDKQQGLDKKSKEKNCVETVYRLQ